MRLTLKLDKHVSALAARADAEVDVEHDQRRQAIKRTAIVLITLALVFYFGIMVILVLRS